MGGLAGGLASWIFGKKPDLTMGLNGILAGLVGITAGPDTSFTWTLIIGLVCGVDRVLLGSVLRQDEDRRPSWCTVCPLGPVVSGVRCSPAAIADGGIVAQVTGIIAYGVVSFGFALVPPSSSRPSSAGASAKRKRSKASTYHEHGVGAYHGIAQEN